MSSHLNSNSAVIRYDLVSRNLIALYTPPYCAYPRCRLKKQIKNFLVPNATLGTCNKKTYNRDAWSTGAIRTRRQHSRQVFLLPLAVRVGVCGVGMNDLRVCWEVSVIDAWYGRCLFARTRANTEGISFIVSGSAL